MPRDLAGSPAPLDIAVIGGGIAGLAAAWLLAPVHRVTVYERERRVGGHSNTVDVIHGGSRVPVDTGFIVFNERNYPNLTRLFETLDVATQPSTMSFAVSLDDGRVEYSGSSLGGLFAPVHRVTVYERERRVGGHSNTVDVIHGGSRVPVDTGFIVFNERNYPNLTRLFETLDVVTQPSTMSFAVSLDGGRVEYSGSSLGGLFAQRRNLLRPRFWRMLRDTVRFYREGPRLISEPGAETLTLGAYLDREGYSAAFVDDHLLPMAAAIWSTPVGDMRGHPALAFVRFCMAHGLMQVDGRPQWRTVTGGSRSYVGALTERFVTRIRAGAAVRQVRRTPSRVVVTTADGSVDVHDRVIVAAHADEALAMLADASADERRLLGAFGYTRNTAVLHSDGALMPKRRAVWSSWNYLAQGDATQRSLCVTYWMNSLQSIDPAIPLFVTLNPPRLPRDEMIHGTFVYDHPAYTRDAIAAQAELTRIQGRNRTWFCGSYFGAGFHEDALVSGLAAAEQAGGVRRPWLAAAAARLQDDPVG